MRNALICGLVATAFLAGPARAQDSTLTGGLLGGAAGAGIGYAFGKGKGAAIGGVTGLALGALAGNSYERNNQPKTVYAPPPTYYAPAPSGYYYAPPPPPQPAYAYYPAQPAYAAPAPAYAAPAPAPVSPGYSTANCREYSGTITIDGRQERSYGTACLQPDGTWRIVR